MDTHACIHTREHCQLTALRGSAGSYGSRLAYAQLTIQRLGERHADFWASFTQLPSLCKLQAPRNPDFLCFLYLSGPLHYAGALLPCVGLGRARRQKTRVNESCSVVPCLKTLVACILSRSIIVCSKRVSLKPSVAIVARSSSPPSAFATYCLPFVMPFLKTPVPSRPLSLLWTPFRCYVISYFSPSLRGWSSLHAEPYPILSGVRWLFVHLLDSEHLGSQGLWHIAASINVGFFSYCDNRRNCSLYHQPLIEKSGIESPWLQEIQLFHFLYEEMAPGEFGDVFNMPFIYSLFDKKLSSTHRL